MLCYQVQSKDDEAHDQNAHDAGDAPTLARARTAALLLLNRACKMNFVAWMSTLSMTNEHTLVVVVGWREGDFIGLQILILPVRCWQRWIDVRC